MSAEKRSIKSYFYPETQFGGFTRVDGSMEFYHRIAALLTPTDRVLDYGAGRGAQISTDPTSYGRWLKTIRGRVAHVEGCDVDPAVLTNPYVDHATVFDPSGKLPFSDNSFDLIYSNWVFEHVSNPRLVASELLRVLKPGGHICAMTPNKRGYISIAARIAGNRRHIPLLRKIQPDRYEHDVFPTVYALNTQKDVQKHFGSGGTVVVYHMSSEPSYFFNSRVIFWLFMALHRITPEKMHTTLFIFIKKKVGSNGTHADLR